MAVAVWSPWSAVTRYSRPGPRLGHCGRLRRGRPVFRYTSARGGPLTATVHASPCPNASLSVIDLGTSAQVRLGSAIYLLRISPQTAKRRTYSYC